MGGPEGEGFQDTKRNCLHSEWWSLCASHDMELLTMFELSSGLHITKERQSNAELKHPKPFPDLNR